MSEMIQLTCGELTFDAAAAGQPDAPLVLLLHGFPQTLHTWRQQMPALADAGYYAIAPNQRGYSPGARPDGTEHYTTDKLVADALALADAVGAEQFDLVGHDWGGQLSWLLAAYHPERVKSLTVLSRPHPAAFVHAMKNDEKQSSRSSHHKAFQDPDMADKLLASKRLDQSLQNQGVTATDVEAYLGLLSSREALDAALNWYRAGAGDNSALLAGNVPVVQVPTLYIWGDEDSSVGRMAAEKTAEFVTGSYQFEVLPGVGHFVTDQAAETVTRLLLAHLRQ